jgi:hypothetical protein
LADAAGIAYEGVTVFAGAPLESLGGNMHRRRGYSVEVSPNSDRWFELVYGHGTAPDFVIARGESYSWPIWKLKTEAYQGAAGIGRYFVYNADARSKREALKIFHFIQKGYL